MKEATGELSTTVIAVVAIAAVLTLFTTIFLPAMKSSIAGKMHCSEAYACDCGTDGKNETCACKYDTVYDNGTVNKTGISVNCDNPNV